MPLLSPRRVLRAACVAFAGVALLGASALTAQGRPASAGTTTREPCAVDKVVDGDTVNCADGTKVRLLLIDTPERSQKPYGPQATTYLRQLILRAGGRVWLEYDVRRTDRYQRTLAYLWTDPRGGTLINEAMVAAGFAEVGVYPPNIKYVERMRAAKAEAQQAKRGLWAVEGFRCSPADFRAKRCR